MRGKLSLFLFTLLIFVVDTGCGGRPTLNRPDISSSTNPVAVQPNAPPADSSGSASRTNIRHIVVMLEENHSFDSYLGQLGAYRAANGLPDDVDGLPLTATLYDTVGNPVHPFHSGTVCTENLSPSWNESHIDVDGGRMDKFMKTSTSVPSVIDPTGTRAMGYYDWTDFPYYYALASTFGTSDRFFSALQANTLPNRMYLFAASSFGHIYPDKPPAGGWTHPTIFDHLDKAKVSWRYYYQDTTESSVYLKQWATYARDADHVFPISRWYNDIQDESTLPSVIFIDRAAMDGLDEHPGHNLQLGAANTAKIVNSLLQSPSWASSVFVLTYDEGGGFYDHVPPVPVAAPDNISPMLHKGDQPGDFAHSGFRVPLFVISPWVKPHYISHVNRDVTSILRLIEVRFNVAPLTVRDAAADDMTEFFDFSSPALLNPPTLPVQPTSGVCNLALEKAPGI